MVAFVRNLDRVHSLLLAMALAVLALYLASLGPNSVDNVATVAAMNMILALGIYVFSGNSGVISFGQLAFAAVGAYAAGIVRVPVDDKANLLPDLPSLLGDAQLSPTLAVLLAGGVAGLAAAILAVPLMRLTGLAAGLASLALLFIVQVTARGWEGLTRGAKGLSAVPRTVELDTVVVWLLIVMAIVFAYQLTRAGLRLRSSREDEVAAQAIGVHVGLERGLSFVLSGFIMGIGGALYAMQIGAVDPDFFFIQLTFLVITMMVIGGFQSVAGAIVGAIVVSAIAEIFRRAETGDLFGIDFPEKLGLQDLIIAALLFLIIVFRPEGLTRGKEFSIGRVHRWAMRFEHRALVEPKEEKPPAPTPTD